MRDGSFEPVLVLVAWVTCVPITVFCVLFFLHSSVYEHVCMYICMEVGIHIYVCMQGNMYESIYAYIL